jgi:hypothetical protein
MDRQGGQLGQRLELRGNEGLIIQLLPIGNV